jgi:hypothetical protein
MGATSGELDGPRMDCRTPLHEECPQHYGRKVDPKVTPRACVAPYVGGPK